MFNFIFSLSVNPSCVSLNVCCNPSFLAATLNKGLLLLLLLLLLQTNLFRNVLQVFLDRIHKIWDSLHPVILPTGTYLHSGLMASVINTWPFGPLP